MITDTYAGESKLNTITLLMNAGTGILFLSSIPMILRVWKNRETLKDYDFIGSVSIFLANLCFNSAFYLMKDYVSITLNLTTMFYWGIVSYYSWKNR